MTEKKHLILSMVSFPTDWKPIPKSEKTKQVIAIANQSKADLLVFPGFTLGSEKEFEKFQLKCKNKKSLLVLEVLGRKRYFLFCQNGKVLKTKIFQYFKESSEVENNPQKMSSYLEKLTNERLVKFKGLKLLLIICGEITFLKSMQSGKNQAIIRSKVPETILKYNELISKTDVFINPQHTPMGRQGNLDKKRKFLSANKRCYCSTTNTDVIVKYDRIMKTLDGSSLQYFYYNGNKVQGEIVFLDETCIVKEYQLPLK